MPLLKIYSVLLVTCPVFHPGSLGIPSVVGVLEIECLLVAYLQALVSEFVAVVSPREYCQAVQWQRWQQGQMSSVETTSSLFIQHSSMHEVTEKERSTLHPRL